MSLKNYEQQIEIAKKNHKLSMNIIKKAMEMKDENKDFIESIQYYCEYCEVGYIAELCVDTVRFPRDDDDFMLMCKCCKMKYRRGEPTPLW